MIIGDVRRSALEFPGESLEPETQVEIGFLTSPEYQLAHAADDAFIKGLYADVLGRQADAGGLAFWEEFARHSFGRAAMAEGFLTSTEEYERLVDNYYTSFLGRHADPIGEMEWVMALQSRMQSPAQVAEGVLDSDEFWAKVT